MLSKRGEKNHQGESTVIMQYAQAYNKEVVEEKQMNIDNIVVRVRNLNAP